MGAGCLLALSTKLQPLPPPSQSLLLTSRCSCASQPPVVLLILLVRGGSAFSARQMYNCWSSTAANTWTAYQLIVNYEGTGPALVASQSGTDLPAGSLACPPSCFHLAADLAFGVHTVPDARMLSVGEARLAVAGFARRSPERHVLAAVFTLPAICCWLSQLMIQTFLVCTAKFCPPATHAPLQLRAAAAAGVWMASPSSTAAAAWRSACRLHACGWLCMCSRLSACPRAAGVKNAVLGGMPNLCALPAVMLDPPGLCCSAACFSFPTLPMCLCDNNGRHDVRMCCHLIYPLIADACFTLW